MLIEVHNELQTDRAPEVRQRNVRADGLEFDFRVERKELPLVDKAVE